MRRRLSRRKIPSIMFEELQLLPVLSWLTFLSIESGIPARSGYLCLLGLGSLTLEKAGRLLLQIFAVDGFVLMVAER